jgi:hypothetical protein
MNNLFKAYLKKLQPLTGLLLIFAFLMLSYCPLRRAIQDLVKGTHPTDQAKTVKGLQPVSAICLGFVNSANEKLILPETKFEARTPLGAIGLLVFYFIWSFLATSRFTTIQIDVFRNVITPIPLYLKNRRLLI